MGRVQDSILQRLSGINSLTSDYLESKFELCFIDLSNVKDIFSKRFLFELRQKC